MTRQKDLLVYFADAFEDGRTLDHAFLVEHGVTFDECMSLSQSVATFIRGYLRAPRDLQNVLLLLGATYGDGALGTERGAAALLDAARFGAVQREMATRLGPATPRPAHPARRAGEEG